MVTNAFPWAAVVDVKVPTVIIYIRAMKTTQRGQLLVNWPTGILLLGFVRHPARRQKTAPL